MHCIAKGFNIRYINHAHRSVANVCRFLPLMVNGKWRVGVLALCDLVVGEEMMRTKVHKEIQEKCAEILKRELIALKTDPISRCTRQWWWPIAT